MQTHPEVFAKHSPAPWTVPGGGKTPAIYSADGDLIAQLDNCGDRAEADAALMNAAPDMLAQLTGWAALMDPASPDYDPAFSPSLASIRAAIAAATGSAE